MTTIFSIAFVVYSGQQPLLLEACMANDNKDFFARVYDIVAQIPPGYVLTYGQIAAMAGNPRAARIVGYAMNGAPADRDLPCHRVVNRAGCMAPGYV